MLAHTLYMAHRRADSNLDARARREEHERELISDEPREDNNWLGFLRSLGDARVWSDAHVWFADRLAIGIVVVMLSVVLLVMAVMLERSVTQLFDSWIGRL